MSLLNVINLTHGFADRILFKDACFRLLKGEHIGLVGANGVGKTTFMNILTGNIICDEGKIEWNKNIKIGYLDQNSTLESGKSIKDILRKAYKRLYDIERDIHMIGDKLTELHSNNRTIIHDESAKLLKRLGHLQDVLDNSDFYRINSNIENIAAGLGIKALGLDTNIDNLSGGQRTKVLLAKLLLENPDILLLDEPTNYLDKEHIEWLTDYLKKFENSFILISHDTKFLSSVVNVIYHIEFTQMKRYPGNYEKYLELSAQEKMLYAQNYESQQREIERLETYIQKNIARASTSTLAKSRVKQLARMDKIERPQSQAKPVFVFNKARESGKLIFECLELEIGYSYPLLNPIDKRLERGEKIAITGCNGIGKSTLLKTILGIIPAIDGIVEMGEFLYPAYYEQEMRNKSSLTALEEVWHCFPRISQKEIRSILARCGLKQEHIGNKMSSLSGGEQSKVRLCKLMLTPSNWLVLDEPTNHLDKDAKSVLKECLKSYNGTILMICHEKDFYEDWVTNIWDMHKYSK